MKNLDWKSFGMGELNVEEVKSISGGQMESEIRFLMDANGWSRSMACEVLGLADKYAGLSSNPCTGFNWRVERIFQIKEC